MLPSAGGAVTSAVAAVAAVMACSEDLGPPGAHGVAWHGPAVVPMMAELWRRGVRAARFDADKGVHPLSPLEDARLVEEPMNKVDEGR